MFYLLFMDDSLVYSDNLTSSDIYSGFKQGLNLALCVLWLTVRMTHLFWHLLYYAEKCDFLLFWESFELV